MKFTGERMIPECNEGQDIYLQHMTRYIFSKQFCQGKVVLDIACGSGYGSKAILDSGAKNVIGVDISKETILYCKEKFTDNNIEFLQGSVEKIPLSNDSVDIVVSFETIEHVDAETQVKFLEEVKRVMKSDGILIVSTPNSIVYPNGNKYHLKELTPDEFQGILSDNFNNVQLFFQDDIECSYLFSKDDFAFKNRNQIIDKIEKIYPMESMYLVAVCSNFNLDSVQGYVGLSNMKPYNMHIKYEKSIKDRDTEIKKKDQEIQQKDHELQQKESELHEIRSSMRWKIPNYFYKLYKNKIKKHIPKKLFLLTNFFIDLYLKVIGSFAIRMIKKYYHLSELAIEEYRTNGLDGLGFALKRHWKKRKGELLVSYPTTNDYTKSLVSIGILTINRLDLIRPCIESIEKNLSKKYKVEIIIGDTGTTEKEVWDYYKQIRKKYKNIRVIKFKKYFFSKNYNDLVRISANGEYLIFLNNDIVAKGGWIDNLIEPLENKKIGIVGGKLLYSDKTIQHAGIGFKKDGGTCHVYSKENKDLPEANFAATVPAVTFACVAMRHDVYDRFQLSEDFKEEAQDTDLCLRLREVGFVILYNPQVEIVHLECSTRDWRRGEDDRILLAQRWGKKIKEIASHGEQRAVFDFNAYENAIVVVRDDGIGDLLMGVSAFHGLRQKYPNKKLVLLTYERNTEMMDGFKIFDEILPIPNKLKYSPLPIPTVGTKVYNLIDLEMQFGPMYSTAKEANKVPRHISFTNALEVDDKFELVNMPTYPEAKKEVLKLINESEAKESDNFVVFNLSATNPARSWWEPYYPKLISAVKEMGFTPLIVGTQKSKYLEGDKIINLVGKTKTITEYIEAIKLGKYVISTDTSAYHIAALSEIPFLVIFTGGVTPEARLSFYNKYEAIEPKGLSCHPCWDEGCKDISVRWKKDPCRLAIKPEEVIEKFKKLVEKYPR
jgi:GT2 family glycosyltransferase/ADP-heptose:LPS heptosyltransferase/2-polyprenyl-3-methyl-5-hydroxy-6-metoxy-1,4-benzoquinol methylase